MTKSNNEWVPEVGTECEYQLGCGHWFKCKIKAVCEKQGAIIYCDAAEYGEQYVSFFGNQAVTFREIKTEAEKRRDVLIRLAHDDVHQDFCCVSLELSTSEQYVENAIGQLIDAGWIKPKPLTEGVISRLAINADHDFNVFAKAIENYIYGESL